MCATVNKITPLLQRQVCTFCSNLLIAMYEKVQRF